MNIEGTTTTVGGASPDLQTPAPNTPGAERTECAAVFVQGAKSVETLFGLFSRFLPLAMVNAEQIGAMVSTAVSYDLMAQTPDFDLMEIVTPAGEHYHIVQGAFTGAGVTYLTVTSDGSPAPRPAPPPLPIPA